VTVASRTSTRAVTRATVTLSDFFIYVFLLSFFVRASLFAFVLTAAFSAATVVILDDEGRTKAGVISVTIITVPVVGS